MDNLYPIIALTLLDAPTTSFVFVEDLRMMLIAKPLRTDCQAQFNLLNLKQEFGDGLKLVFGAVRVGREGKMTAWLFDKRPEHLATPEDFALTANEEFHARCWIEDKEGRVYDVIDRVMERTGNTLGVTFDFEKGECIVREEKTYLMLHGLHYVPSPPHVQEALRAKAFEISRKKGEVFTVTFKTETGEVYDDIFKSFPAEDYTLALAASFKNLGLKQRADSTDATDGR